MEPHSCAFQMHLQVQQTLQIMRWNKYINIRERGAHAASNGLIIRHPQEWVQPDQLSHAALDNAKFRRQHFRLTCVPSVTQDHEYRIARKKPPAMKHVQHSQ